MRKRLRTLLTAALTIAALVTPAALDTAPVIDDALIVIHYTAQQPTCHASQLGRQALVIGNGHPFHARCERDGQINVWNA